MQAVVSGSAVLINLKQLRYRRKSDGESLASIMRTHTENSLCLSHYSNHFT